MSYSSTLGILEIGVVISGILFGILTTQIYFYHKNFPEDLPWIRYGLVNGIWLVELIHTVCVVHEIYFYSVIHFGDAEAFTGWPASFAIAVICHGVVAVLVQGFLAYRIARFTGHLCILIILCYAVMSFILFQQKWQWLILTVLALRAALDVTISATLVYHLTKCRDNAYKNTIAVIDKLILWAIETGIVTSVISILIIICYTTIPHNYIWLLLYMVLPRVFSNTMLANLNSRDRLRSLQTTVVPMSNDFMSNRQLDGSMRFALESENEH
ncbi:hypothetical protein J3R30DRAFT_578169 [Lentinula aciculospora]|uniref:DUF6534 domain-containing protein n=1 Tax=Lentinula aciculospora TaxID=153920 RepID=A0A9W9DL66_9AGAR|nr:hypothetical protein J3R30DRAFT_578169 [Lentinula aciculospora]